MGKKLYIVVLVALFLSVVVITAEQTGLVDLKSAKIVKIDKAGRSAVAKPFRSKRLKSRVQSAVSVPIVYIDRSPIGNCYREDPLMFGILTMIASMTLVGLGFVVHMLRTDPRFR